MSAASPSRNPRAILSLRSLVDNNPSASAECRDPCAKDQDFYLLRKSFFTPCAIAPGLWRQVLRIELRRTHAIAAIAPSHEKENKRNITSMKAFKARDNDYHACKNCVYTHEAVSSARRKQTVEGAPFQAPSRDAVPKEARMGELSAGLSSETGSGSEVEHG